MVFEHLYSAAEKTVPALQQLKKIDMTDMSQGVMVSLSGQPIPKLLCDATGYSVDNISPNITCEIVFCIITQNYK
jgi:hypothetical protein